jgi:hypothetical protein
MAAAMSTQFYNRAPVYVVDPKAAWQFLKRRIFDAEGIELIQRPYSTFKDTVDSLQEAEKIGACRIVKCQLAIDEVAYSCSFR